MQMKSLGIINVNLNITDQLMTMYATFDILSKKWEYNGPVHQLYIDLYEAYDSVGREVLCSVLTKTGNPQS
jgi:hypothetical protein